MDSAREQAYALHAMKRALPILLALAGFAAPGWSGEAPAPVITLETQDGTRLFVRVRHAEPLVLRTTGPDPVALPWADLRELKMGMRVAPDLNEQAQAAVLALSNDNYETRDKAMETLRALGRTAAPSLQAALASPDAEVQARAAQLLGALGLNEDAGGDRVRLADGRTLSGKLELTALALETAWHAVTFPPETLHALTAAPEGVTLPELPAGEALLARAPPPRALTDAAERFDPLADQEQAALVAAGQVASPWAGLAGIRLAGFDKQTDGKTDLAAGANLSHAYAEWGLLLRAAEAAQQVVADDGEELLGFSRGLSAAADPPRGRGDIEARFIRPGSFEAGKNPGRPGAVHAVGCVIANAGAGQIGLEAFDRHGQLILRVLNRQESDLVAGGAMGHEWLALKSKIPIHRVRIFRTDPQSETALRIDDLFFDRVVPVERDERFALLELSDGQRLVGQAAEPPQGSAAALRPAFLDPQAAPWPVPLERIARFEPPLETIAPDGPAQDLRVRLQHDVLMQSGECFRAQLRKLDGKTCELGLAGGVTLTLPRALLRKIDLWPDPAQDAAEPVALAVKKDEKTGVEFRQKHALKDAASPQIEETPEEAAKPKDPNIFPTQGLPRMDLAEILRVNLETNELVVDPKDGAGEWPIDLSSARYLVFPESAQPAQAAPRLWRLVLRQGSAFDLDIRSIGATHLVAELMGSEVRLPFHVIEAVYRKPLVPPAQP
ncbi:MAG: hypothetical protein HS116_20800 [Planctomycetes bacterium]|nr:hypothetical protein [Planctomycetota bacterium]